MTDTEKITPEQRDQAKAWTCIAHIMSEHPDADSSGGMIFTVDDRMYWDRLHTNLSVTDDAPSQTHGESDG